MNQKYEIKLNHNDYILLLDTLTEACKSATDIKSIMRLRHLYDECLEAAPEDVSASGPAHLKEE